MKIGKREWEFPGLVYVLDEIVDLILEFRIRTNILT